MKLPDRGSRELPWISFTADSNTGVAVIGGKVVFLLDAEECEFNEWLHGICEKGHIDKFTKFAIIAAIATGDGVLGAITRRFVRD